MLGASARCRSPLELTSLRVAFGIVEQVHGLFTFLTVVALEVNASPPLALYRITVRSLTALVWAAFSLSASLPLTAGARSLFL